MSDLCLSLSWRPLLYGSDLGSDSSPAEEKERRVNCVTVLFVWGRVKYQKVRLQLTIIFTVRFLAREIVKNAQHNIPELLIFSNQQSKNLKTLDILA